MLRKALPFIEPRNQRTLFLSSAVLVLVFLFHHRFFYVHGGYLLDSAWNAFICYRNGILPVWPHAVESMEFGPYGYSAVFYQYHASPIISLFSLASYIQPLNLLDWFSFLQAVFLALITYAMCSLADWFLGDSNLWTKVALGGALGLVFAFNGFVISCLAYPHLEMPLLAFGLCFLVSLFRSRHVLAGVCFALACGAREDAGFHLCAWLAALWIASHIEPHLRSFKRRFLLFAVLGFAASVTLMVLQKIFLPIPKGIPSALQYAFVGPEGLHISWAIIRDRFVALWLHGLVLVLPVVVTVVVAAVTRKWILLVGWIVYLPWFLLNFLSNVPSRQVFEIYHGFPFVFAVAWPLLVLRPPSLPCSAQLRFLALPTIFLLGISSAVGLQRSSPGMFKAFWSDLADIRYQSQKPFETLIDSMLANPALYGRVGMDDPFGCLYLDHLETSHILHQGQSYDTLVFFRNTMFTDSMIRLMLANKLDKTYELAGTNAIVASNRDLSVPINGQSGLRPVDFWLSMVLFHPRFTKREADGSLAQKNKGQGILAYGPYCTLPAGKYRVIFKTDYIAADDAPSVQNENSSNQPVALLEVCKNAGRTPKATRQLSASELPAVSSLVFEVTPDETETALEFRVTTSSPQRRLRLSGLSLEPF